MVVLDIYATSFLSRYGGGAAGKALEATGEGLDFGLDFSDEAEAVLETFATSIGLTLCRHYFLGSSRKSGAYMVVAELVVPS